MKKLIHIKKVFVAACILSIALFIFPLSSFGEETFVYRHEGEIEGLVFDFGGLPVELPGLSEVHVTDTVVIASGREIMITTPSGRFNYHTRLGNGEITAYTMEYDDPLIFEFESATLIEHFNIEPPIPDDPALVEVPEDVDLFFKVKEARLIVPTGMEGMSFDLMLKLKHGDLQLIMFKP